jgi:hypothetical protein
MHGIPGLARFIMREPECLELCYEFCDRLAKCCEELAQHNSTVPQKVRYSAA